MSIIKKVSRNNDGTYDASWSLTDEQMSWLLTYAINDLVSKGEIDIKVLTQEQLELDYLEVTNPVGNA